MESAKKVEIDTKKEERRVVLTEEVVTSSGDVFIVDWLDNPDGEPLIDIAERIVRDHYLE